MFDENNKNDFNQINPDEYKNVSEPETAIEKEIREESKETGLQEEKRTEEAAENSVEIAEETGTEEKRYSYGSSQYRQEMPQSPSREQQSNTQYQGFGQYQNSEQYQNPGQSENLRQNQNSGQSENFGQNQNYGQRQNLGQNQNFGQSQNFGQNQNPSRTQGSVPGQDAGEQPLYGRQQGDYRYGQENRYYQNPYPNDQRYQPVPPEPPKKQKKKHTMAARIAGLTAAALLFGTVAGGTMVGINVITDRFISATTESRRVALSEAETEAGTEETTQQPSSVAQAAPAIVTDVSAIVEQAMPSVVAINNTMLYRTNSWFGPSQTYEVPSSGSGIIVGENEEELLIVTNNHVVADSSSLNVSFIDNESVEASIKGTDSDSDLAVIAVKLSDIPAETLSQISIAKIGDSDSLKVGQGVIAIGNALGYGQSVTVGYVSALNRQVKTEDDAVTRTLLQTDAAINPGNSGGALLNMQGELIGINAAKYSSTEVEGMGYAIPISQAQDIINDLMNKKTKVAVDEKKQGYLGIQGKNIDETASREFGMPKGVYVYKILEDGAASKSDLREKDIITKFDGESVRSMANLQELLTYYEGGETVTLTVQSLTNGQYEERSVEITLGFKPEVNTVK